VSHPDVALEWVIHMGCDVTTRSRKMWLSQGS
jgi:hypothetical protein